MSLHWEKGERKSEVSKVNAFSTNADENLITSVKTALLNFGSRLLEKLTLEKNTSEGTIQIPCDGRQAAMFRRTTKKHNFAFKPHGLCVRRT